jgi:hypothetical protein
MDESASFSIDVNGRESICRHRQGQTTFQMLAAHSRTIRLVAGFSDAAKNTGIACTYDGVLAIVWQVTMSGLTHINTTRIPHVVEIHVVCNSIIFHTPYATVISWFKDRHRPEFDGGYHSPEDRVTALAEEPSIGTCAIRKFEWVGGNIKSKKW